MNIQDLQTIPKLHSSIIGASALTTYIVIFFLGRRSNRNRAKSYAMVIDPALQSEFAKVGVSDSALLFQDSPEYFYHHASGRKQVPCITTQISFAPRHCLVTSLYSFFFPKRDTAKGQLLIESPPETLVSFAIVRRSFERKFREQYPLFTSIASSQAKDFEVPKDFIVLCDVNGPTQAILNSCEFFKRVSPKSMTLLKYFFVVEKSNFEASRFVSTETGNVIAEFELKLPLNPQGYELLTPLYEEILSIGDRVSTFKPTPTVLAAMEAKRRQAKKEEMKENRKKREQMEAKLKEEKEKEFDRQLATLPADVAAMKKEERKRLRAKREERKRAKGGVQRIVMS
ncbi:hypothetical protein GEMRC1_011543 [Eukaryota sp. GEM-RC1]